MSLTDEKTEPAKTDDTSSKDPVVQYILVRTDLKWGCGAMMAQACHACIASIVCSSASATTKHYLDDLDNMHKIILKVETGEDLLRIEKQLKEANIDHHLWIEKPEYVASCLAVSPQYKSLVHSFFKHLKLFK